MANIRKKKKFDELTFSDDWMFKEVLGDPNNISIVKEFIEMVLERKIYSLTPVKTEVSERPEYESHGVRFDAQFNADDVITVIEMQTYRDDLNLRAKYYNDMIDVRNFDPDLDYDEMPSTMVIFVLTEDFLHGNLQKYTVKSSIQEKPELKYDDKRITIFINPKASDKNEKLNRFCEYINTGKVKDTLTQNISKAIDKIKMDAVKRGEFMSVEERIRYEIREARKEAAIEGRAEGRAEGRSEGRAEGLKDGMQEGIQKEKIAIAKKLLSMNFSDEEILRATGLSEDEVNNLKSF